MNISYKTTPNQSKMQKITIKTSSGFTLVELLITLAVLGILVALAAPSFMSTVRSNQMQANYNHLIQAIKTARNEAVSKASNPGLRTVNVCALDTSSDSVDQCATPNQGSWQSGWTLGLSTASTTPVKAENQIKRMQFDYPQIEIRFREMDAANNITTTAVDRLSFNSQGRLISPANGVILQVCDKENKLKLGSQFKITNVTMMKESAGANECQ